MVKKVSITLLLSQCVYAIDAGTISKGINNELETNKPLSAPTRQLHSQQENIDNNEQGVKVFVQGFKISENTLIATAELQKVLSSFIGKKLSFSQLENATRAIADYYRDKGFAARAFFPPQEVNEGKLEIIVLEGKLSAIEIQAEAVKHLSGRSAQRIIESAHPIGKSLDISKLEKGLITLNDSPGISISSQLEAGQNAGDTKLKVNLRDTASLNGAMFLSNNGARSTGHNQFIVSLGVNSPLGIGDQITLQSMTTSGIRYGKVGYSLPVGYDGARVGATLSKMGYEVVSGTHANGTADTLGVTLSYPLVRSSSKNVIYVASLDKKLYSNFSSSALISDKEVNVLVNTLNSTRYDQSGSTTFSASWTLGDLNLKNCESDYLADVQGKHSSGNYGKLNLVAMRNQMINESTSFLTTFITQKSNKNLDSSEKMYLGGSSGIRAYPANEAGGDQGYMLNVELIKSLPYNVQTSLFYDFGRIEQNYQNYNGFLTSLNPHNTYNIQGWGTSAWYTKGNFNIKGVLAWRVGTNLNTQANGGDNDGTKNTPHVWISSSLMY